MNEQIVKIATSEYPQKQNNVVKMKNEKKFFAIYLKMCKTTWQNAI